MFSCFCFTAPLSILYTPFLCSPFCSSPPFYLPLLVFCSTVSLSSYTFLLSLFSSTLPSVVWHLYPTMRCCGANILSLPSASFSFSLLSPVQVFARRWGLWPSDSAVIKNKAVREHVHAHCVFGYNKRSTEGNLEVILPDTSLSVCHPLCQSLPSLPVSACENTRDEMHDCTARFVKPSCRTSSWDTAGICSSQLMCLEGSDSVNTSWANHHSLSSAYTVHSGGKKRIS